MATIKSVHARAIFDSRGNPTVEVDVTTDLGTRRARRSPLHDPAAAAAAARGSVTGTY